MKNYLYILVLISIISCKENAAKVQEKKSDDVEIIPNINSTIQQIANLYIPEKITINQGKIRNKDNEKNYEITLSNSNLLDDEKENIENYAEKIANLYYKNLIKNIIPFDFDKIIVEIEHKNGKKEIFKYTEKDFLENGIEFTINNKFTIKVAKIDDLNFKYSILKAEPFNKKLEIWNTENLFEKNGENETIEFYFGETENKNVMLVIQSWSKYSIKFKSEIQTEENGEFLEIQNVETHKGSKTTESWATKTYKIRLSKFELKK